MKKFFIALIFAVARVGAVCAQEQNSQEKNLTLTVDQAVECALKNSWTLKSLKAPRLIWR